MPKLLRKRRKPEPGGPCIVCGQPTGAADKNTDGTWAHAHCLAREATR